MNRRTFLRFLGLAPVGVPAAIAASESSMVTVIKTPAVGMTSLQLICRRQVMVWYDLLRSHGVDPETISRQDYLDLCEHIRDLGLSSTDKLLRFGWRPGYRMVDERELRDGQDILISRKFVPARRAA